jgi:hypothetical protein
MPRPEMYVILDSILAAIEPADTSECVAFRRERIMCIQHIYLVPSDIIKQLNVIFPEEVIVGALVLIDYDCGMSHRRNVIQILFSNVILLHSRQVRHLVEDGMV